ncbi:uncharacterized protein EI90DRAFT_3045872 [Cantharellus anzutake]|uniref:uncharacterized protein n=1 Tax=Cantharellus anzutake TaxID=1750568 RepID=UPI001908F64A|nr:uncharacterized protein EI90DRAFT_3045872 [Cantharellus anzutake]KAF8336474.1 hypothetical protein EI90DRAFT_3045872 [Cantharellus anzutake]
MTSSSCGGLGSRCCAMRWMSSRDHDTNSDNHALRYLDGVVNPPKVVTSAHHDRLLCQLLPFLVFMFYRFSLSLPNKSDILQGITCATSAGLLIFVALVELVAGQSRCSTELQRESARKQFGALTAAFVAGV